MSEASEDTRVGIKAAFPVKKRELNGLNRVAAFLNDNRAERIPIAGYVEFVKHTEKIDGDEMTVALVVVEAGVNAQGRDDKGHAEMIRKIVEERRKSAGKPSVAETLFDGATKRELDEQLDGQIEGIDRDAKIAAGETETVDVTSGTGDLGVRRGEAGRSIPEKSAEELAAERAEGTPAAEQTVTDPDKGSAQKQHDATKPADVVRSEQADVAGGIVRPGLSSYKPGRKPRGATVRPPASTDPFDPKPVA